MAKTNLAEINDTIETAIANENEAPRLMATEVVYGFLVPSTKALDRRRTEIENYQSGRRSLIETLDNVGVKPLAILPKKAWERICDQSNLLRLSPRSDGLVAIDIGLLSALNAVAIPLNFILWFGTAAAIAFAYYSGVDWYGDRSPLYRVAACASIFFTIFGFLVAGLSGDGKLPLATYNRIVRGLARLLDFLPTKIAHTLLPIGISKKHKYDGGATLNLPMPPPSVADVIDRVSKQGALVLRIALVPEALRFVETPSEILRSRIERDEADRRARRAAARAARRLDPIVYIEKGSAVAIVAQFGDFPIEQEVVARVAASEHLV